MYRVIPTECRMSAIDGKEHFGRDVSSVSCIMQYLIEVFGARKILIEKMDIEYQLPKDADVKPAGFK